MKPVWGLAEGQLKSDPWPVWGELPAPSLIRPLVPPARLRGNASTPTATKEHSICSWYSVPWYLTKAVAHDEN